MTGDSPPDPHVTDEESGPASFRVGATVLRAALADMSSGPGVYRMLDAEGEALYVGKARSLRRRVASVRVRVEKLDVYADAASVGIEIERRA